MSISQHDGKTVLIKSTGFQGTIIRTVAKRGLNAMSVRMIVRDVNGVEHELQPHQFVIQ